MSGANATGNAKATSLMVNGLYDFRNSTPFTPYLGLGVGYGVVDYSNVNPVGGSTLNDSNGGLAYQGILGVDVRVVKSTSVFIDYRQFTAQDAGGRLNSGTSVDGDYTTRTALIGLRYRFEPPPPPPAAPITPVVEPSPPPPPRPTSSPATTAAGRPPPPWEPSTCAPRGLTDTRG